MYGFFPKSPTAGHILLLRWVEGPWCLLECLAAGAAVSCRASLISTWPLSLPLGGRSRVPLWQSLGRVPESKADTVDRIRPNLTSQACHFCCIPLVKISYKAIQDSSGIEISFSSSWENWQTHIYMSIWEGRNYCSHLCKPQSFQGYHSSASSHIHVLYKNIDEIQVSQKPHIFSMLY